MPKSPWCKAAALSLVCLAVLLSPGTAIAAGTVRIGNVDVPADSALAKKEHPRLLFTKADLPAIRARIAKPSLKPLYDKLKQTVDQQMNINMDAAQMIVPLGLLYHITGDARYGQACREVTVQAPFGYYATMGLYGYDLVYDLLTPGERASCEAKILQRVRAGSAQSTELTPFLNAIGMWGNGTNDTEIADAISAGYTATLARKVYLEGWAADRGGDGNSHDYIGQHEYVGTMSALQAWRASTGQDLFENFNWARTMGPYYLYNILPGSGLTTHIGVDALGQAFFPWETGAEGFISIAQTTWRDGLTGWWAKNTLCGGNQPYYYVLMKHWGMVLFYDPDVPDIAPSQMPQDMLFKIRGYLAMRSDWSSNATYVHFACGRFELDSRNCCHNNSFIIYRKAYLACDTGSKWSNNEENTVNSDGQHYSKWFPQSIAHNTITVGTRDNPTNMITTMCGGQVGRVPADWLTMYGMPISEDNKYTRQAGEIKAYETSPEFAYVVGDATKSYDPHVVNGFTRQFVYIRPGAIVIFDRVNGAYASDAKRWYLHTMEKPLCIDGALNPDTSVHSSGHFLATGKTLRAPHGGSALFSKTILPESAIIRVLGGKGHQFEVKGINYDMYDPWYQTVGTAQYQENVGLGLWRAEVEPQVKQANDVFLHVLWATDDTVQSMFNVTKIEQNGQVGVRFTADGSDVEVTFAQTGNVAGHIKITKNGNVVCDRPLASQIEDNYQKWCADSRFNNWMTNQYLRSAIGAADQDLLRLTATAVSASQINLSWNDIPNETSFKIERKTGTGGTYAQIGTTAPGVLAYSDTQLAGGTTYYYRVRASYSAGDSQYSNEASATIPQGGSITVASPNGGEIWAIGSSRNVTWTSSGSVGNVDIELSTNGGSTWRPAMLAANTANDASQAITVPDAYSKTCRVRIKQTSGGSPADISDANFTITLGGDATLDGYVDGLDFSILLTNWHTNGRTFVTGDFTGDGYVDGLDFSVLLTNWHVRATPASNAGATGDALSSSSVSAAQASDSQAAGTAVKVNFQPASAAVPAGGLVDSGMKFGPRGNGYSYGWASANTTAADRNSSRSADQRYDTLVNLPAGNAWEIALPNGTYSVKVVCGDAASTGTYKVNIETVPAIDAKTTSTNRWIEQTMTVVVTDGKLTIAAAAGSSNAKICFVEIAGQ